jgi:hypothetical protein
MMSEPVMRVMEMMKDDGNEEEKPGPPIKNDVGDGKDNLCGSIKPFHRFANHPTMRLPLPVKCSVTAAGNRRMSRGSKGNS